MHCIVILFATLSNPIVELILASNRESIQDNFISHMYNQLWMNAMKIQVVHVEFLNLLDWKKKKHVLSSYDK
jgi:hypothetical protein